MQINPTSNATVTGNIDRAAASAMGFQVETTEDMAVLMDILSSLYSDPRTAILREYAVNGRDAHLVAGVTEPVQITLPSEFDSTLRIRDFGTGLTAAEMDDIYGVYLKSTKRGTTQTGGFGIGAKSAFAESRQFIVTSIKDGIKNVVLFALDDNNIGTKNVIVAGVATDEPSGVQVEIPFREHTGFAQTARRVFEVWPSGTALIDGTLNVSILDRCTAIDDSAFVLPDEWERRRDVSVIMGGVAYPLPAGSAKRVRQAMNADSSRSAVYLVAQVNDLSPAPTREALKDTDGNRAWIEAQIESLPGRVAAMHAPPRHEELGRQVRDAGARIRYISDGDVAGSIMAAREGTARPTPCRRRGQRSQQPTRTRCSASARRSSGAGRRIHGVHGTGEVCGAVARQESRQARLPV
ncbi:histidine kinase/DNA gyrase B/HSP90-like ATPase [Yimella lutea]|uniref:Histidine kinase/DNA gyrase B/HSP90-like ATPase n=1 Tax=Yimella lutea TaxID=587872 RepID=A0A542EGN4_9MICO|nr:histidine kinase/DNA gyrase B/HSP90-like ATPase [Yimella lutea]